MGNRFDTPYGQRYVSQYVPLPFEAIGALGEKMQKQQAVAKAEMNAFEDALSKIDVVDEVVAETPTGIGRAKTGYRDYKNKVISDIRNNHQQLANDYADGKYTPSEFDMKIKQLHNNFMQDYNKLKIAEANSKNIKAMDEAISKSEADPNTNTWLLNKVAIEGSNLIQNPFDTEYKITSLGKVVDYEKAVNEHSSHYADQVIHGKLAKMDPSGYLVFTDKSGVTEKRVENEILNSFDNTELARQTKEQIYRDVNDGRYKYKLTDKKDFNNDGKEETFGDYLYSAKKQEFLNAVKAKAVKSQINTNVVKDWKLENSLKDEERSNGIGLGKTIPSLNRNTLSTIPSSIKDAFKENLDGTYTLDINGLKSAYGNAGNKQAGDRIADAGGWINLDMSTKDKTKSTKELIDFLKNATKIVGFNGKISNTLPTDKSKGVMNMTDLINDYMKVSAVLDQDYQLSKPEQIIEKDRILKNRTGYEYFDKDGVKITNPLVVEEISKSYSPDRIVQENGLTKIVGTYIDTDGKEVIVKARDLAEEKNNIFDIGARVTKGMQKYMVDGKSYDESNDKSNGLSQLNKDTGYDKDSNIKIVDYNVVGDINKGGFILATLANPNARGIQQVKRLIPNPNYNGKDKNSSRYFYTDIGGPSDVTKFLSTIYYKNTPQGNDDLKRIPGNNIIYKETAD